nr:hypothetical protein [Tanacetum cinerariifolium]
MDVKSDFLYGSIGEEVYLCQPPGFEDHDYPDKVYKVVKALYGLHQAPRAWYETLANYLSKNRFQRGNINQTLFIKKQKGELTFFLGLQVKQKDNEIFINQDKYVARILRKFGLTDGKSASTPIDTKKPLLKDLDDVDVDVHIYRSMISSLMYLTLSRPGIMFVVCACARFQVTLKVSHLHEVKRIFGYLKGKPHLGLWYPKDSPFNLVAYSDSDYAGASLDRKFTTGGFQFLGYRLISWQCIKQTVVATSSSKAEYVAAASCYAQTNDVVRLQALIDRKKVIITDDIIRQALRLDDADGVECIPNEEIFVELARMGYKKPSTELTFYKAFSQPNGIDDLSTHNTKYTSPALTQKVFANMRMIGKVFSGVDTPLFDGMLVQQQVQAIEDDAEDEDDDNEDVDAEVAMDADVQGRLAESQEKVYHLDLQHAEKVFEVVTTAATTITAAQVPKASAPRRMRGVVIQDPEETATALVIMHSEVKSKDKATPLALKVTVVDYQIHHEQNKPYYKIIRANGTHQLFLSLITLLKNFDREDLEMLWKLVQERFQSSEPKNFLDDFLLNTLKITYEKPNVEASVWREKKYPLMRFTLEQMLNNVRLEVEEVSEMSLELQRSVEVKGPTNIIGTIDGKVKIVTEASVRRHLKLADCDGISSLPTTDNFEQLSLMGIPIRQETEVPQPSSPPHTNVIDEAASTSVDVRHGGAATTVTHLDVGQGNGNIDQTPTMPHDSLLLRVNTLRSDEGMLLNTKLIKKVKKLEKTVQSRQARKRARIVISDEDEDDLEDSSKQGRMIAAIDQDPTIFTASPEVKTVGDLVDDTAAKTLVYIRRSEAKAKDIGKGIIEESESLMIKTKGQKGNKNKKDLKLSFDEIKDLFEITMRRVNTFVPMETEVRRGVLELVADSSQAAVREAGGTKRAGEKELGH